ncbi:hypothetical protein RhiirA5_443840 [Rhizophagus irregularis]|uniref:Uncharacterized protein n=1 Tax=Rhizophagus irregularis TaxID=588596 RepID=A0A2N0NDL0_9GLOM|nr:hypothetical protein RhiirA5_443840 [Rhizophagus irregularis]
MVGVENQPSFQVLINSLPSSSKNIEKIQKNSNNQNTKNRYNNNNNNDNSHHSSGSTSYTPDANDTISKLEPSIFKGATKPN